MRFWVPIKRVPDTTTRIRPVSSGKSIDPAEVKFIINPYDEFALEECLKWRDALAAAGGSHEVIALSVGPADAAAVLRQALAMGADRAVHLEAAAPTGLELDNHQIASALAAYLKTRIQGAPEDVVFLGKQSVDLQSGVIGSMLARLLGLPRVAEVVRLEWIGDKVRAHHRVRGKVEIVELAPPLLLTAQKGLNEPRYPALKNILAAKKKAIETVPAQIPEAALEIVRLELPPPRGAVKIVGNGPDAVPELLRLLRTEAKVL